MTATPAPTPARVDELAKEYLALKDKVLGLQLAVREASEPLAKMQDELRELVGQYGSAHAEKSKLLHGITHEIMATFGSSVSIDAAAVERFRQALVKAKLAHLVSRVFTKTIRWSLAPTHSLIIKSATLSKHMLAVYSQCEVVQPKTPTLTVRAKG